MAPSDVARIADILPDVPRIVDIGSNVARILDIEPSDVARIVDIVVKFHTFFSKLLYNNFCNNNNNGVSLWSYILSFNFVLFSQ